MTDPDRSAPTPNVATTFGVQRSAMQERILKAQAVILQRALRSGVKVSFGEGRRATDIAMVLFKGDRDAVLALPAQLEDELEFDLHVLRSTFVRENFELLIVFMEPLDEQALRSPERRGNLRQRLQQLADEEATGLLELGQVEELAPSPAAAVTRQAAER